MTKFKFFAGATICAASMLFGCSGKSNSDLAMELLQQADTAIAIADYNYALQLLDTLKAKYPEEINIQRCAMHMRPMAIEGVSISQLEETDSLQALYAFKTDSLMSYFKLVHDAELGADYDYYIAKELKNAEIFGKTGLQGRVSPSGEFTLISSLTGPGVKHTKITLSAADGQTVETATIAYDGERNYRSSGTESITFIQAECDTIGQFLVEHPQQKMKLNFVGSKSYSMALPLPDRRSIELAWQLAECINKKNKLAQQRQLLERQLALARDQIARTSVD
ncbi:MAG: hypothetical protein NC343_04360 [Muribaculum sp.]|nr:hypothetical protein [Muribaculaceae bacterium]MCM1080964.1 hypothetical protein [Muribaculum sp.]